MQPQIPPTDRPADAPGPDGPGAPSANRPPVHSAPDLPDSCEVSPDELLDEAQAALASVASLRAAVRQPGFKAVQASDGRLMGGEQVLAEADELERKARMDLTLASAMLLVEVREVLIQIRGLRLSNGARAGFEIPREMLAEPEPTQIFASAPPGTIPHPGSATPENAPSMPCSIEVYHTNHLWWGPPTDGGVVGAPVQQRRYFCGGVRYPAPAVRTPQASSPDFGDKA